MRRSHALAGVLLACGLVASSCGGDSESDGTSTGGKGGTGKGGSGGSSATGGSGNTGGGSSGAGGASGGSGGSGGTSDGGTQCGTMTCASDQACCPGLEYCYPATCSNCCPSVIDGGSGGSGGGTGTGGGGNDGGPQQCGFQTCGPSQSCCSLGTIQYCYQTSCTFCCQGGFDGGFGGFGGGFDGGFGGFGNFGGGGPDSGFGGFGNFGGFGGGTDASFGGFGNFGGGPSDGGKACGSMACGNGFSCCKNQYCYPSACLSCCQP